MAQLRRDFEEFVKRDTVIIAVGPDRIGAFKLFWQQNNIPFIGLSDRDHKVAKLYDQEVNLLKAGRVPAQVIIDKRGIVRYVHYSNSMADIPADEEIYKILDEINKSE